MFWWVELDLFSLECNEVSSSEFWGVDGFGMALGSLSFNAQGCVSVLLENLHGMSSSGTCWLLGGAWFQCRYGGFWMSTQLINIQNHCIQMKEKVSSLVNFHDLKKHKKQKDLKLLN